MGPSPSSGALNARTLVFFPALLLFAEFFSPANAQTYYQMPTSLPPNPVPVGSNLNLYWYYK